MREIQSTNLQEIVDFFEHGLPAININLTIFSQKCHKIVTLEAWRIAHGSKYDGLNSRSAIMMKCGYCFQIIEFIKTLKCDTMLPADVLMLQSVSCSIEHCELWSTKLHTWGTSLGLQMDGSLILNVLPPTYSSVWPPLSWNYRSRDLIRSFWRANLHTGEFWFLRNQLEDTNWTGGRKSAPSERPVIHLELDQNTISMRQQPRVISYEIPDVVLSSIMQCIHLDQMNVEKRFRTFGSL